MSHSSPSRSPFLFNRSVLYPGVLWLTAVALFPLACGEQPVIGGPVSTGCTGDADCADGEHCQNKACIADCDSCGTTCNATNECPLGQYCSPEGSCQQNCVPGGDAGCMSGQTCNEDGRCIAKNDIEPSFGGAGGGSGDGDEEECIDVQVDFTPQIPNVVLLIDQSGSMTDETSFKEKVDLAIDAGEYIPSDCPDSPNGSSSATGWDNDAEPDYAWRWNVVRDVLFHPERGIVKPLEDKIRFGLSTYSSNAGFGRSTDADYPRVCPTLTEVDLKFTNHQAMLDAFACSHLVQDTPTRESLTAVAEKLAATDLDGPKIIVLATDGEPDTCACSDFNTSNGRPPECVAAGEYMGQTYSAGEYEQVLVALEAQRIHDELGITIEVINVGLDNLKAHLDTVASYGGAVSGASIDGTSPGALTDAFQTIIDGVRSCVIDLDGMIAKGQEDTGVITLDGVELEYNGTDGWVVLSPSQIELVGTACEAIKSGEHDLDVSFPCESFEPIQH